MFQQKEQLLEKYELTVNSVSRGRGTVIADTDKGRVVLKEYHGSPERLEPLQKVLSYLKGWDEHVEQLLADAEENLTVEDEEGKKYILKTCCTGKECDTTNPREIIAAAEKMASLHKAFMAYDDPEQEKFKNPEHTFASELCRHNRELRYARNYVSKKKKKNAFEELFLKNFSAFFAQAQEVEQAYADGGDTGKRFLCHGDFNQHNVICSGGKICIINFEQIRQDEPVGDLAKFMRKVLEKNRWDRQLGEAMLRAYERVRPLEEKERRQLTLRLAYPVRFWNIANHYYNSRKAWVSQRDIEKLEKLLMVEECRKQFLEILYSFE